MSPEHEQEFREFVAAQSTRLLRIAVLLTCDRHLAEDLVQTALMSCARRWGRIRDRQQPLAYVRKAMYRHQYNWWRSRGRRPESIVDQVPDRDTGRDHAADAVEREEIMARLRTLPPRQRAVVVLSYYEDRPEAEVATMLGVSVGTVRSQKAKALAKLRVVQVNRTEALA